jgi:uncharacterized protein (TIGR00251 family)
MVTLHIFVKPGAKVETLTWDGRELVVKLAAPAQEGKANARLVNLLTKRLDIAKSRITIDKGSHTRYKKVTIDIPQPRLDAFLDSIMLGQ